MFPVRGQVACNDTRFVSRDLGSPELLCLLKLNAESMD